MLYRMLTNRLGRTTRTQPILAGSFPFDLVGTVHRSSKVGLFTRRAEVKGIGSTTFSHQSQTSGGVGMGDLHLFGENTVHLGAEPVGGSRQVFQFGMFTDGPTFGTPTTLKDESLGIVRLGVLELLLDTVQVPLVTAAKLNHALPRIFRVGRQANAALGGRIFECRRWLAVIDVSHPWMSTGRVAVSTRGAERAPMPRGLEEVSWQKHHQRSSDDEDEDNNVWVSAILEQLVHDARAGRCATRNETHVSFLLAFRASQAILFPKTKSNPVLQVKA
jgi:hypothetical protein